MITEKTSWGTVNYDDNPEIVSNVFNAVMKYFFDHDAFCGEVIQQSDDCIIDAPECLASIADMIGFISVYKED
jgi:hypothetical protein